MRSWYHVATGWGEFLRLHKTKQVKWNFQAFVQNGIQLFYLIYCCFYTRGRVQRRAQCLPRFQTIRYLDFKYSQTCSKDHLSWETTFQSDKGFHCIIKYWSWCIMGLTISLLWVEIYYNLDICYNVEWNLPGKTSLESPPSLKWPSFHSHTISCWNCNPCKSHLSGKTTFFIKDGLSWHVPLYKLEFFLWGHRL